MTQPDFVRSLETDPALKGAVFDRAELLAWVASMWPHVAEDPDAGTWAGEFLEACQAGRRRNGPAGDAWIGSITT
jgi:hypothetical protein